MCYLYFVRADKGNSFFPIFFNVSLLILIVKSGSVTFPLVSFTLMEVVWCMSGGLNCYLCEETITGAFYYTFMYSTFLLSIIHLPFGEIILHEVCISQWKHMYKNTYKLMLKVALFVTVPAWKECKCPWINTS
jgi:hypothetical protein